MNENQRTAKIGDEQIRRSGTGGPIPAEDLNEQELREAKNLGTAPRRSNLAGMGTSAQGRGRGTLPSRPMFPHEITLENFCARQKRVVLEGIVHLPVEIAYTDVGAGEPLMLLHGIPTWSFLYHRVIDRLAEHYRVIAPDFLGHGYSDRRDCFDRSLRVQARMIRRLLDHLGLGQATLVGHDTGGGVALILAIEHPQVVDRLVLSNSVAYDSWPIGDMLALGDPAWKHKSPQEVLDFVSGGFSAGLTRKEQLTDEFRRGITAPYADEQGKLSLIRNASALNTSHTMALVDRHARIRVPTLLLWGVDDPWQTVRDGERLHEEIPNSRLVRMENTSHWLQQDAPDEFVSELLLFLGGTSSAAGETSQ
jgi:haloalkane dehalogenase